MAIMDAIFPSLFASVAGKRAKIHSNRTPNVISKVLALKLLLEVRKISLLDLKIVVLENPKGEKTENTCLQSADKTKRQNNHWPLYGSLSVFYTPIPVSPKNSLPRARLYKRLSAAEYVTPVLRAQEYRGSVLS